MTKVRHSFPGSQFTGEFCVGISRNKILSFFPDLKKSRWFACYGYSLLTFNAKRNMIGLLL